MNDLVGGLRVTFEESNCEKDLRVYISSDLRWKSHEKISATANKILGLLVKTFENRDVDIWKSHLCLASSSTP